jgi:hypothetical protein
MVARVRAAVASRIPTPGGAGGVERGPELGDRCDQFGVGVGTRWRVGAGVPRERMAKGDGESGAGTSSVEGESALQDSMIAGEAFGAAAGIDRAGSA